MTTREIEIAPKTLLGKLAMLMVSVGGVLVSVAAFGCCWLLVAEIIDGFFSLSSVVAVALLAICLPAAVIFMSVSAALAIGMVMGIIHPEDKK